MTVPVARASPPMTNSNAFTAPGRFSCHGSVVVPEPVTVISEILVKFSILVSRSAAESVLLIATPSLPYQRIPFVAVEGTLTS